MNKRSEGVTVYVNNITYFWVTNNSEANDFESSGISVLID